MTQIEDLKIARFEKKSRLKIPKGYEIIQTVNDHNGNITVKRPDDFIVFLNDSDDSAINYIRLHAKREDVIMAVGLYRGMQIANNYKEKHGPAVNVDYMEFVNSILQSVSKIELMGANDETNKSTGEKV